MEPLVSVVTTLFNYARYLPELWTSVQQQTYKNWEWVLVDDGSEDRPHEWVYRWLPNDRIKFVRHNKNLGYAVAKNTGLRAASGEYFAMIDADDVLLPGSLSVRLNELQRRPDKLWVHADALNYNVHGDVETTYVRWINDKRRELERQGADLTKTYHHRLVHSQTVMVRREFHERLGLYDETLRFSADNEMWRRAIACGLVPAYVPEPVAIYRVHDARMSRSEYKRKRVRAVKEYIVGAVKVRATLINRGASADELACAGVELL